MLPGPLCAGLSPISPPPSTPPGLYGHSAVYHEDTDAVYVFGGHRFHVESVSASPELYSLYCPNLTWSLLAPSQGRKVRGGGGPWGCLGVLWGQLRGVGGRPGVFEGCLGACVGY